MESNPTRVRSILARSVRLAREACSAFRADPYNVATVQRRRDRLLAYRVQSARLRCARFASAPLTPENVAGMTRAEHDTNKARARWQGNYAEHHAT